MEELKDYILIVPNIVPSELCSTILSEYKECDSWIKAIVGSGKEAPNIRNCETIGLSFSEIIEKNAKIRQKIDQDLFSCAANAIKEYKNKFTKCTIEEDSGYDLLKYEVGSFYIEHVDSFKARPRAVSCSFVLNDDYEGGEFAFFGGSIKYKLEKGACIMFPSNFMYPHEITPVTSGTRYSIVTWFI
jgi:predicted 2-oxoglutarate/Fe(II)-dependent dioxygenase YbiX